MKNYPAYILKQQRSLISCIDCEKEVQDSDDEEVWTLLGRHFRCRKCSDYEGMY